MHKCAAVCVHTQIATLEKGVWRRVLVFCENELVCTFTFTNVMFRLFCFILQKDMFSSKMQDGGGGGGGGLDSLRERKMSSSSSGGGGGAGGGGGTKNKWMKAFKGIKKTDKDSGGGGGGGAAAAGGGAGGAMAAMADAR